MHFSKSLILDIVSQQSSLFLGVCEHRNELLCLCIIEACRFALRSFDTIKAHDRTIMIDLFEQHIFCESAVFKMNLQSVRRESLATVTEGFFESIAVFN